VPTGSIEQRSIILAEACSRSVWFFSVRCILLAYTFLVVLAPLALDRL
jgi:hypothetical protein